MDWSGDCKFRSGQYLSVHEFVTMAFLSLDICRFNLKSQYKPGSLKKVLGTSEDIVSDANSSTRSFPNSPKQTLVGPIPLHRIPLSNCTSCALNYNLLLTSPSLFIKSFSNLTDPSFSQSSLLGAKGSFKFFKKTFTSFSWSSLIHRSKKVLPNSSAKQILAGLLKAYS
jgi:hypothetical protein